jgi:hypothetical protein
LVVLIEWIESFLEKTGRFNASSPKNWTPKLVIQMNYVISPITQAVDFWLDSVIGGYVTEFTIYCIQSYNFGERDFFKGPCERFLKSLNMWIHMLFCENNVMVMQFDF